MPARQVGTFCACFGWGARSEEGARCKRDDCVCVCVLRECHIETGDMIWSFVVFIRFKVAARTHPARRQRSRRRSRGAPAAPRSTRATGRRVHRQGGRRQGPRRVCAAGAIHAARGGPYRKERRVRIALRSSFAFWQGATTMARNVRALRPTGHASTVESKAGVVETFSKFG